MPTCKKCQKQFPNAIYIDGQRKKIDTRVYCLECSPYKGGNRRDLTKPSKDSYQNNKEYLLNYYYKRQSRKLDLVLLKGSKCQRCGYDKCLEALEFHHRNPKDKKFALSREYLWKTSWDKILEEVDKCDLMCANCHRETHSKKLKSIPELILEKQNE